MRGIVFWLVILSALCIILPAILSLQTLQGQIDRHGSEEASRLGLYDTRLTLLIQLLGFLTLFAALIILAIDHLNRSAVGGDK